MNVRLVNKELLENKGYMIHATDKTGWFFKNTTEISISKNDPVTTNDYDTKIEEYERLKKAAYEADFHMTHIENDEVSVEYYISDKDEKSE